MGWRKPPAEKPQPKQSVYQLAGNIAKYILPLFDERKAMPEGRWTWSRFDLAGGDGRFVFERHSSEHGYFTFEVPGFVLWNYGPKDQMSWLNAAHDQAVAKWRADMPPEVKDEMNRHIAIQNAFARSVHEDELATMQEELDRAYKDAAHYAGKWREATEDIKWFVSENDRLRKESDAATNQVAELKRQVEGLTKLSIYPQPGKTANEIRIERLDKRLSDVEGKLINAGI